MFALLLFGILILFVGVTICVVLFRNKKVAAVLVLVAAVLISVILTVVSCIRTVPTGHTGILTTFGKVEDITYEAGVHFTAPWKTVVSMDNRNQKATIDMSCFSSDIQNVTVKYTINYQIEKSNAQKIYKQIGVDYYNTVIVPRVQETVKGVISKYNAEAILEERTKLSSSICDILTDRLKEYNIEILDTSLEDLDFSDAFTDAVEAKQVAEQRKKQATIEQEQKNIESQEAAKRADIDANAAASVAKINAEAAASVSVTAATAEYEVVKIQADSAEYAGQKDSAVIAQVRDVLAKDKENLKKEDLDCLLMYYYVQKWNGQLPETYLGSDDFYAILQSLVNAPAAPVAP